MFNKNFNSRFFIIFLFLFIFATLFLFQDKIFIKKDYTGKEFLGNVNIIEENEFQNFGLSTDTSKSIIDIGLVLSGGPGKNGIPAINNPKFTNIINSEVDDDTRGILVFIDGIKRFYPYSILVWHEIVNDNIGDKYFSVTFCPLCDSGIVFNRRVRDSILQFGVSGLLFESNLLMYDLETESLWSQAAGEAVVGEYSGTELDIFPLQVITFSELKNKHPDSSVLSTDTGYSRNYSSTPYGGYLDTEDTVFPTSFKDKRFSAKELFYVFPFNKKSYSIRYKDIEEGEHIAVSKNIEFQIKRNGGEITIMNDENIIPGYFELWFSWSIHHEDDGVVLDLKNKKG